jgi:nucleoid-associated protein YgaU
MPDIESEMPATAGEVSSVNSKESTSSPPVEVSDPAQNEPESMVESPPSRNIPSLNRPPTLEPNNDPAEMDPDQAAIQQAADKRRPDPEEPSPPKLPKYGEPPQATIESVPDRDSRTPPRGADRSADATEPLSPPNRTPPPRSSQSDDHQVAGQRTYVVKEGDSFWSISARQYGTGKHFRALEEYNKDRLSTSGSGGRVLRPGTVIALPDESLLQSNNTRRKPAEPSATKSSRSDPWREDSSFDSPPRRDTGLAPKRDVSSRPGTYRVKDGDTLSTIALRELGTSKRWQEIFQLNRDRLTDETSLRPGMDLKMPSAATAEKAAGRPNF